MGEPFAEVGAVGQASVRQGTLAAAHSRCSGGTIAKNGCRAQLWTCLTNIRNGFGAPPTSAVPLTQ